MKLTKAKKVTIVNHVADISTEVGSSPCAITLIQQCLALKQLIEV